MVSVLLCNTNTVLFLLLLFLLAHNAIKTKFSSTIREDISIYDDLMLALFHIIFKITILFIIYNRTFSYQMSARILCFIIIVLCYILEVFEHMSIKIDFLKENMFQFVQLFKPQSVTHLLVNGQLTLFKW